MQSINVHDNRLNAVRDDSVAVVRRFCEIADLRSWILDFGEPVSLQRKDSMLGRMTLERFTRPDTRADGGNL